MFGRIACYFGQHRVISDHVKQGKVKTAIRFFCYRGCGFHGTIDPNTGQVTILDQGGHA